MATSILNVPGIGPSTAAILAEEGIATAEDLATQTVAQLTTVHTFSETRATHVIAAARKLLTADESGDKLSPVVTKGKKPKKGDKKKKADKTKASKQEKKKSKTSKKEKTDKKVAKMKKEKKSAEKSKKKKSKK